MNTIKKEKGFTIIEVVLVLAIAGLIFLMVFIALPSLQKSQRDGQRRTDVARVVTKVTDYSNNNRGGIPTSLITQSGSPSRSFVQRYLGGTNATTSGTEYLDPVTGTGYVFLTPGTSPTQVGQVGYAPGSICGTDGAFTSGSARQYALAIFLESSSAPYCVDSR